MKKQKAAKKEDSLLLTWTDSKDARNQYQEMLLQADVEHAVEFWLRKARMCFEDRGTISNYHAYLKDLLKKDIFSQDRAKNRFMLVFEISDFYDEIIERINDHDSYQLSDRRYRVKALISFSKFLHEETDGKVKILSAPPMLRLANESILGLENSVSKPQVLTEEEFRRLNDAVKSPKQRDHTSFRDYLVLEMMYQTARPLLDVLALQKVNIDFANQTVIFSKENSVPINQKLSNGLETYLGYSQSHRVDETFFITREGKPIFRTHFYQVLKQASAMVDLGFVATFKMIQWAYVAKRIQKDHSQEKILKELKLKKIPKNIESVA